MNTKMRKLLAARKRRIAQRLDKTKRGPTPAFGASNIHYEISARVEAVAAGGVGLIHQMVQKLVLDSALNCELIDAENSLMRTWLSSPPVRRALGRNAGSEGYLGFSQALFVTGARSVVLSLWKVNDNATALLMSSLYQNMLGQRDDLDAIPESRGISMKPSAGSTIYVPMRPPIFWYPSPTSEMPMNATKCKLSMTNLYLWGSVPASLICKPTEWYAPN